MLSKDIIVASKDHSIYLMTLDMQQTLDTIDIGQLYFVIDTKLDIENNQLIIISSDAALASKNGYSNKLYYTKYDIIEENGIPSFGTRIVNIQLPLYDAIYNGSTLVSNITIDADRNNYFILRSHSYSNSQYDILFRVCKVNNSGQTLFYKFDKMSFGRTFTNNSIFNVAIDEYKGNLIFTVDGVSASTQQGTGCDFVIMNKNDFTKFETKTVNRANSFYISGQTLYTDGEFYTKIISVVDRKVYLIGNDSNLAGMFIVSSTDIDTFETKFVDNRIFSNNKLAFGNLCRFYKDDSNGKIYIKDKSTGIPGLYDASLYIDYYNRSKSFIDMKSSFIYNPAKHEYIEVYSPEKIVLHNASVRNDTFVLPNKLSTNVVSIGLLPSKKTFGMVSGNNENELVYPKNGTYFSNEKFEIVFSVSKTIGSETQQFRIVCSDDLEKLKSFNPKNPDENLFIFDSYSSGNFFNALVNWSYTTGFNSNIPYGFDINDGFSWQQLGTGDGKIIGGIEPSNGIKNSVSANSEKFVKVAINDTAFISYFNNKEIFFKIYSNSKK